MRQDGIFNAIAYAQQVRSFDVQSAAKIGDWPLVHMATGHNKAGKKSVARGIIAVGDVAIGRVAMGSVALGVVVFGAISAGVIALGALALSRFWAMGDYARKIHYVDAYLPPLSSRMQAMVFARDAVCMTP